MITIFCTPKPFRGHIAMIQRNALQSWKLLGPDMEVMVFGDEEGAAEVCRELGLRHEPGVQRTETGTKRVDYLFSAAQRLARHDLLCYANCDIVFPSSFRACLERLAAWRKHFLMVGRRWDLDVTEPLNFDSSSWQEDLLGKAVRHGRRIPAYNIDYFAFPRGLFAEIPPLVLGRIWWDHWLVWKAAEQGAPVVDASRLVYAVHQNHDYAYHPQGKVGVFDDAEANRNFYVAGGWKNLHTIADASHRLTASGIRRNYLGALAPLGRVFVRPWRKLRAATRTRVWHPLLRWTAPVRHALGLRREVLAAPVRSLKLKLTQPRKHSP